MMTAMRELSADELASIAGGGINLGNIAAISNCPKNNVEVIVAFGVWNMTGTPQTPPAPCTSLNDDDTGYCTFF